MKDFVSDTDRDILDNLVEHRVVTAAHLSVLLEVPARTIRYRLCLLKTKGYARSVRPPADKGSSPDHWCPTRRADSWAKGERAPKGGDKAAPSTTFVEHSGAITALYVALLKATAGLGLSEWAREGGAAEEFEWRSRPRKIVPDAFMVLADKEAAYRAFVEVDLGSMSMTRLSQKISGYAAYYAAQAWNGTHPFPPVLLLATTSEARSAGAIARFEQRLAQAGRHLHSFHYRGRYDWVPEMGACACARYPDEAVSEPVWLSAGGGDGLYLTDLLRPPLARWAEQERTRRQEDERREQWRQSLRADPERCRREIQQCGSSRSFEDLAEAFDQRGSLALNLLLQRDHEMDATERAAFTVFSRRLAWSRRGGLTATDDPPPPSEQERRAVHSLVDNYAERQKRYAARLYTRCPGSPAIHNAIAHLDGGDLLRHDELSRLPGLIVAHRNNLSELQRRRHAYLTWRAQTIGQARRAKRALARLIFDPGRAAEEIDLARLWFCKPCGQPAIPTEHDLGVGSTPDCCLCKLRATTKLAEALGEGLIRPVEDGFWAVCHPPVPAWVLEEAARPLAKSAGPNEEW
ncbi:MAG: replication-relaxation family protein [Actinomycetota bacterium]